MEQWVASGTLSGRRCAGYAGRIARLAGASYGVVVVRI